jgi:DNA-binding transcriptional ArsR family regulator
MMTVSAIALMSCVSVAGFAGSFLVEEGRYRWVELYSKLARASVSRSAEAGHEVLRLLARRPGLKLRDIKRLTEDHPIGMLSLVGLERNGLLASFRDGLSRRFYLNGGEIGQVDALRTRILLWILDHPGIWEAQVAKDLGVSQQIVHYHLKKLRETKLITTRVGATGNRKLYRFVDSAPEAKG